MTKKGKPTGGMPLGRRRKREKEARVISAKSHRQYTEPLPRTYHRPPVRVKQPAPALEPKFALRTWIALTVFTTIIGTIASRFALTHGPEVFEIVTRVALIAIGSCIAITALFVLAMSKSRLIRTLAETVTVILLFVVNIGIMVYGWPALHVIAYGAEHRQCKILKADDPAYQELHRQNDD